MTGKASGDATGRALDSARRVTAAALPPFRPLRRLRLATSRSRIRGRLEARGDPGRRSQDALACQTYRSRRPSPFRQHAADAPRLAARRLVATGVVLGFAERESQPADPISPKIPRCCGRNCATDTAACWALLARSLWNSVRSADIAVTLTETGIDLMLIRKRPLTLGDREALADFGEAHDLARIAWRSSITRPAEPVAIRRTPLVRFGSRPVALPSAGFLQPSLDGETVLTRLCWSHARRNRGADRRSVLRIRHLRAYPRPDRAGIAAFDGDPELRSRALQCGDPREPRPARGCQATRRALFRDPLTPHGRTISPPRSSTRPAPARPGPGAHAGRLERCPGDARRRPQPDPAPRNRRRFLVERRPCG